MKKLALKLQSMSYSEWPKMRDYLLSVTQNLIQKKSVTPLDDGAIHYLAELLKELGFTCQILEFGELEPVLNLYAKYGNSNKNFAFAGHTDVVPAGDEKSWKFPAFSAVISEDIIFGRGAVDMKGAIAAFVTASKIFLEENPIFSDSISLIITGDEEAAAVNGTVKIVDWLKQKQEVISHCLVGEPSNPQIIGEMIKIGRRGSINFTVTVLGKQGHVAYPENASNPNSSLVKFLNLLVDYRFDEGSELFDRSNLEITSIDTGNHVTNLIPASAKAKFNIRFNDQFTSKEIIEVIEYICSKSLFNYELNYQVSGESFYNNDEFFNQILSDSIEKITKQTPIFSTKGGTSDARFIKEICPCLEFGLINKTAHQIDEHIAIKDLETLTEIYLEILRKYFNSAHSF